jgi:hypothetical protein
MVDAIAENRGDLVRQVQFQLDVATVGVRPHDGGGLLRQVVHIDWLRLEFVLLEQPTHAPNHFAGPDVVLANVADDVLHLTECRGEGMRRQQHLCHAGVLKDGVERLVQLVCQRGGELAHGRAAIEVRHGRQMAA